MTTIQKASEVRTMKAITSKVDILRTPRSIQRLWFQWYQMQWHASTSNYL